MLAVPKPHHKPRIQDELSSNKSMLWNVFFHGFCLLVMAPRVGFWSLANLTNIVTMTTDYSTKQSWDSKIDYGHGFSLSSMDLWLICSTWTVWALWSRFSNWSGRVNDICLVVHDFCTLALLMQCRYMPQQHSYMFLFVHSIHDVADVPLGIVLSIAKRDAKFVHTLWVWALPIVWTLTRIWVFGNFIWIVWSKHWVFTTELVVLWLLDAAWLIMICLYIVRKSRGKVINVYP